MVCIDKSVVYILYSWLISKGFLFLNVSKRPFSLKINTQVLLFFENKFPQVKITCFHMIKQRVFACYKFKLSIINSS